MATFEMGSPAVDRISYYPINNITLILEARPAMMTGRVIRFEIYPHVAIQNWTIATFYRPDPEHENIFTARDKMVFGTMTDRLISHWCNLEIKEGDLIGIHWSSGWIKLDEDKIEQSGFWQAAGNQTSCVEETFVFEEEKTISLCGKCIPLGFIKTEVKAEAIASAEDIAKVGGKKTLTINNHLIQTNERAQAVADAYLAEYKDQKKIIVVNRPIPLPYEIGDTIKLKRQI